MTSPLLTLVVTAHRVQHLEAAMQSVEAQTSEAFDIVLVSDSTGEQATQGVFGAFQAQHPHRSVHRSVPGGSAGPVRNAGFDAAQTEWVTYLDGDDVLAPDAIQTILGAIDDDVDMVSTGLWYITEEGGRRKIPESLTYLPSRDLYLQDPELDGHDVHLFQLFACRKSVWERYGYYSGGPGGDDLDFVLHHLLWSRFRKVPTYAYGHRRTPDGFSNRAARKIGGELCSCPCSVRYRSGYYRKLLERHGEHAPAQNFVTGDTKS